MFAATRSPIDRRPGDVAALFFSFSYTLYVAYFTSILASNEKERERKRIESKKRDSSENNERAPCGRDFSHACRFRRYKEQSILRRRVFCASFIRPKRTCALSGTMRNADKCLVTMGVDVCTYIRSGEARFTRALISSRFIDRSMARDGVNKVTDNRGQWMRGSLKIRDCESTGERRY